MTFLTNIAKPGLLAVLAATSLIEARLTRLPQKLRPRQDEGYSIFVGGNAAQVSALQYDPAGHQLSLIAQIHDQVGQHPSWLTWDKGNPSNIFVSDDSAGPDDPSLARLNWDGTIFTVQEFASSGVGGTVHTSLSRREGTLCLFSAGYGSGSISSQVLTDGAFTYGAVPDVHVFQGSGPIADRQEASHPNQIIDTPDGVRIFVPDLGSDKVWLFEYSNPEQCLLATRQQVSVDVLPGSGPRHLAFYFDAGTYYAYLADELSGDVRAFAVDATGGLEPIGDAVSVGPATSEVSDRCSLDIEWNERPSIYQHPTDPVAPLRHPCLPSHTQIYVTNDGRFVYTAVRHVPDADQDFIVLLERDPTTGALGNVQTFPSGGKVPRHFSFSGDEQYVAVANSGEDDGTGQSVAVLGRHPNNGALYFSTSIEIASPTFAGFYA